MKVLFYVLVPVAIVASAAVYMWLRDRQPTSLQSGVESFQREMDALSPDARIGVRRRPTGEPVDGSAPPAPPGNRPAPRRPPGTEGEA